APRAATRARPCAHPPRPLARRSGRGRHRGGGNLYLAGTGTRDARRRLAARSSSRPRDHAGGRAGGSASQPGRRSALLLDRSARAPMRLALLPVRQLGRSRTRTLLTILATGIVIALFGFLRAVISLYYLGFEQAASDRLITRNATAIVQ